MADPVAMSPTHGRGSLGFVRELGPGENLESNIGEGQFAMNQESSINISNKDKSIEKTSFIHCVVRQIGALMHKNLTLAHRNRTATFLRIFSSCFFILLIYLVNEGLMSRYSADPYFKEYPSPPSRRIDGIPVCTPKFGLKTCLTFVYCPAPDTGGGYSPQNDFIDLANFTAASNNVSCSVLNCPEMFRVHRLVRAIMKTNTRDGNPAPIPTSSVLGFMNATAIDTYLSQYTGIGQGAYIFAAAADDSITFAVQVIVL
jgi:hypothetical protein